MQVRDIKLEHCAPDLTLMPRGDWPEVAFVGRSNVGKSSLLNMLCGRRSLARTSRTPGKTQTFNFYAVNGMCFFVDIPGYGYARVSKAERSRWTRAIGAYLTQRSALRLVLHLVDARHAPTALDREVMVLLARSEAMRLVVLTKTDKLSANGRAHCMRATGKAMAELGMETPVILASAVRKTGRDELLEWIGQAVDSP